MLPFGSNALVFSFAIEIRKDKQNTQCIYNVLQRITIEYVICDWCAQWVPIATFVFAVLLLWWSYTVRRNWLIIRNHRRMGG